MKAGTLMPPQGGQPRQWSQKRLTESTSAAVNDLLTLFARYGVLETKVTQD